jgi:hypothetical protein
MTLSRLPMIGLIGLMCLAVVAAAVWWWRLPPEPLDRATANVLYSERLDPPAGPLAVYHLGHSLVGRNMPAMLQQLAPDGHRHNSQLGWGAALQAHWNHPDPPLHGFEESNDHPAFRPAPDALASGEYDVVVLTEMVELRDAIRWLESPEYLARWAGRAREGRPDVRLYLYETWHRLDTPDGWLARLDNDLSELWEGVVLFGALARDPEGRPIHLIPGGQVMATLVRQIEAGGGAPGLTRREDLFSDDIHFNDQGAYLIALVHYAVLYGQSPVGLPHRLLNADGTPADAPSEEAARLMQEVVWDVVSALPRTGVAPR